MENSNSNDNLQQRKRLLDNSVSTWLLIGLIVLCLIGWNAFLAIKTTTDLATTQKQLYQTSESVLALNNLHLSILSAESGQRGYLLTEIDSYLTPYRLALGKVTEQMNMVERQIFAHPQAQQAVINLLSLSKEKLSELESTVELAMADKERRALSQVMSGRGKNLYVDILALINELHEIETQFRDSQYQQLLTIQQEAKITFWISGATSAFLLIGMLVMAWLNMGNQRKLRQSLEHQNDTLTEQVALRTQELTLYSEELNRSNRELEDFAFVASHDLQEPLRKIRAFGDRLMTTYSDSLDGKGVDYINRMKAAAERMSKLINDLLEFSRITTKGKDFQQVNMNELLVDVVGDLEIALEESQTQLKIADLPIMHGDKGQLYQLFLNLLSNAIKFRKPDVSPIIELTYHQESIKGATHPSESFCHIIVLKDNGIGFEQEFADKIFVPFQRLHGRSEYKGTGIGLAVCRRIVERHGGKISAQSQLGYGTEFSLVLPVAPVLFENMESNNE